MDMDFDGKKVRSMDRCSAVRVCLDLDSEVMSVIFKMNARLFPHNSPITLLHLFSINRLLYSLITNAAHLIKSIKKTSLNDFLENRYLVFNHSLITVSTHFV
jgi:hypothetical protein